MNLKRKAITVFGIIAILSLLHLVLFQSTGYADGLSNNISSVENIDSESGSNVYSGIAKFISFTGFRNATIGHIIMIFVGLFFIGLFLEFFYGKERLLSYGGRIF